MNSLCVLDMGKPRWVGSSCVSDRSMTFPSWLSKYLPQQLRLTLSKINIILETIKKIT